MMSNSETILVKLALTCAILLVCFSTTTSGQQAVGNFSEELDSDKDGLSDFQERHKYLTNPQKADSDGDGIADGQWKERREYQYTIRSVVQVMKPVTPKFLNDDFQDARVLNETDTYVELEVIHYPFNRIGQSIGATSSWRKQPQQMQKWLRPGASSDWDEAMRKGLVRQLKRDGIDIEELDDRQTVEQVSKWLLARVSPANGFTTFLTAWRKNGQPYVPSQFAAALKDELAKSGRSEEEQLQHEVSARGMLKHKTCGSCTSTAIYLNGCLRGVGIPTRIVLCIPVIDASDPSEVTMLKKVSNPAVRQHLQNAAAQLKNSWASHTFNEVFVGGRWHRLNYGHLGQGIYDRHLFGLITHVATFHDWADAEAFRTIGRRQKTPGKKDDIFGHSNPYSAIALSDEVGVHCSVELPEIGKQKIVVDKVFWTDDPNLPDDIRKNCQRRGRFGCIAQLSGLEGMQEFLNFASTLDGSVVFRPIESYAAPVNSKFDTGCVWVKNGGKGFIYVPISKRDRRQLKSNVEYRFQPKDQGENGWKLSDDLKLIRKKK